MSKKEHNYCVIWEIDIAATNLREAASRAREIQLDPENIASFFMVRRAESCDLPLEKFTQIDVLRKDRRAK